MFFCVFQIDVERSLEISVDDGAAVAAPKRLGPPEGRVEPSADAARLRRIVFRRLVDEDAAAFRDLFQPLTKRVVAHAEHRSDRLRVQLAVHPRRHPLAPERRQEDDVVPRHHEIRALVMEVSLDVLVALAEAVQRPLLAPLGPLGGLRDRRDELVDAQEHGVHSRRVVIAEFERAAVGGPRRQKRPDARVDATRSAALVIGRRERFYIDGDVQYPPPEAVDGQSAIRRWNFRKGREPLFGEHLRIERHHPVGGPLERRFRDDDALRLFPFPESNEEFVAWVRLSQLEVDGIRLREVFDGPFPDVLRRLEEEPVPRRDVALVDEPITQPVKRLLVVRVALGQRQRRVVRPPAAAHPPPKFLADALRRLQDDPSDALCSAAGREDAR